MKADDKPEYEEADGKKYKEKYTNFEYLEAKVEALQEHIELISKILKQNDMTSTTEKWELITDFLDEISQKLEEKS